MSKVQDMKEIALALQCLELIKAFPDSDIASYAADIVSAIHARKFGEDQSTEDGPQ